MDNNLDFSSLGKVSFDSMEFSNDLSVEITDLQEGKRESKSWVFDDIVLAFSNGKEAASITEFTAALVRTNTSSSPYFALAYDVAFRVKSLGWKKENGGQLLMHFLSVDSQPIHSFPLVGFSSELIVNCKDNEFRSYQGRLNMDIYDDVIGARCTIDSGNWSKC